ncbi:MAG: serine/threonine protein kinase [Anaerolineae bacterium]|nr:serine/threonine protein kinase [Anaerolineae bacterium]
MADELIGKVIGGYEVLGVIGYGGMASVYRAQQVSMKRIVALKVLPRQFVSDDTYMQRFNREVEIVSKLEHRSIVPVYDYGQFEGQPYIIMRYMSGGSVDDMLRSGPLDIDSCISIVEQIAPALDYAHSKDILHRDLKPSNILLDDDGGAYLTDFGIARIIGQQAGATITTQGVVGTPSYMSPEQAQGQPLDGRSDVYSLGITLFEMATGTRPFQSDTPYSIAVMQVTTPPPSPRSFNQSIPLAVEQVIYTALKKKREERYGTAMLLCDALKHTANGGQIYNVHDTQPGGIPKPTRPVSVNAQPSVLPPPALYPTGNAASSRVSSNAVPAVNKRRRGKPRGDSLMMSAAVGGLLGCGLLTIIVIILALIISSSQPPAGTNLQPTSDQSSVAPAQEEAVSDGVSTLDPASEAARSRLLGTPLPELIVTVTPSVIPVGVRE